MTGANGYIGSQLLLALARKGHHITALVRTKHTLDIPLDLQKQVTVITGDLLDKNSLQSIPHTIEAAYYLVHSMGKKGKGFYDDEAKSAENFCKAVEKTDCKQIIYLGGLASGNHLSEHLNSRRNVEDVLAKSRIPLTVLRAGIIIGGGSASFEIIRDLVEKLPAMVAPRWVNSLCQPIAIEDVIFYLQAVLENQMCLNNRFDIGGPEKLTYYDMLLRFAKIRGLRRWIIKVPVLTPHLSSYWLFFVTSISFPLARALVESLKNDAICSENRIHTMIPHQCLTYKMALNLAL
ncbi:MAG: hypothetical protein S4CHLAM45_04110 [Chlamydiales bacterium]|nr:hypothetical protein [Chlamydiales bacterium]MCH9619265.1 hypothetical protein [Chlamydiales bacterium]MCH9622527.1 hypothetical protein [Chlamydiales bacterium]